MSPLVHMVDAGPERGAVVTCSLPFQPEFSAEVHPPPRRAWKVAVNRKWASDAHNNVQEGKTVLWALARCARARCRQSTCVVFTDSMVVIGAFTKGRSPSRALNRLCRRYAALCVAFQIRPVLKYVPSGLNWADGPSRGFRFPCVAPETQAKAAVKLAAAGTSP